MLEPKYKEEYKKAIIKNLKKFDIDDKKIKAKIKKHCLKFDLNEDKIIQKIKNDKILQTFFIYEPGKQNLYEKVFEEFMKKINDVENFKPLPSKGPKRIFILKQKVKFKEEISDTANVTKSMDFYFKYRGIDTEFYIFHKYTHESGGGQDNQRNDVIQAIKSASIGKNNKSNINKKICILFVCDGEYYNKNINWDKIKSYIEDNNFELLKSKDIESFLLNKIRNL